MTDEQMQRTMQFILEQQAKFSADMGQVQENIKRLTAAQTNLAVAQSRTEASVERLTTQVEIIALQQAHINNVVAVITDSQQRTDERLNVLIEIIKEGRNGGSIERQTAKGSSRKRASQKKVKKK
jgi:acetolactate synthase small subunit